ncbi:MAG: HAD family hydrolase [Patescibacteria group bacterium]
MENYSLKYLMLFVKKEIDTVVFDFDGVIINSVAGSKQVIINVAKKYGYTVSISDLKEFSGISWPEMFPKLGLKLGWSEEATLFIEADSTEKAVNTAFKVASGLFKKIIELKNNGLKVGILTTRTTATLIKSAELCGIDLEIFDFLGTADNLKHKKPSPAVWDDLLLRGDIKFIQKILFIGDTRVDLAASKHRKWPVLFFGVNERDEFPEPELAGIKFFNNTVSAINFILTCKTREAAKAIPLV